MSSAVSDDGQVIIKPSLRDYPCRYQDVRHTMLVFHLLCIWLFLCPERMRLVIAYVVAFKPGYK